MIAFNKNVQECGDCEEKWNIPITLESWYHDLNKWTRDGNCPGVPQDTQATAHTYIIPQASFYTCLNRFMESDDSKQYDKDIKYDGTITNNGATKVSAITKINAYRQNIRVKKIDEVAKQGVQYLKDTRDMEAKYGIEGTYSYATDMLNYETYKVLLKESVLSIGLSLVAVAAVVFMITGSLPVTGLVVLSVILVDYFLIALIYYWDLTFNTIIIVNIVIAIGLAVDYSAHIAHTYLII